MGVKSEEKRELWWKMNESHGGRMGVKTEGRGGEEGGETEEYLRTVNRVRQGRTSGTRHSFFCGLRGSISEVDPANVMWESQLQITAETFTTEPAEAPPSPSKLSLKKTITAPPQPGRPAKPSLMMKLDVLLQQSPKNPRNTFCYADVLLETLPSRRRHSRLAAFMSHITSIIFLSKHISTFEFQRIVRKS